MDLHVLRKSDACLDSLASYVQETPSVRGSGHIGGGAVVPAKVLVTGSSGYLGRALVLAPRHLGVSTVGIDQVPSDTTQVIGTVDNADLTRQASKGCSALVNSAALHTPHASSLDDEPS